MGWCKAQTKKLFTLVIPNQYRDGTKVMKFVIPDYGDSSYNSVTRWDMNNKPCGICCSVMNRDDYSEEGWVWPFWVAVRLSEYCESSKFYET